MTTTNAPVPTNLSLYRAARRLPFGSQLFTRVLCLKAPYFGSIHPHVTELRHGYCQVAMPNRRSVHNHLGTVHAIASCNMAELAAGLMTDATIPISHRWIPAGMTVEYRAKATTSLVATARLDALPDLSHATELIVPVDIRDSVGTTVVTARITMHVSPKP